MGSAAASVTVLAGVPNMAGLTVDDGVTPFPDTTTDFVKVLREHGVEVEYAVPRERRRYVGHKAFELWLPILECSRDVFLAVGSGLLVESIKDYLAPRTRDSDAAAVDRADEDSPPESRPPAILHVEFHVQTHDGNRESFMANGAAPDVFRALEEFEEHLRDDEGA